MPTPIRESFGDVSTHHLARELGCVRQDVAAVAAVVDGHTAALSHLADVCGAIRAHLVPDVASYPRPPRIPWRLFATALASAVLALAGSHLIGIG